MRSSNRQAGFSLAEMLIATAVGAFGLAGVAALIGHGIQLQANARSSTLGVNFAVSELERLRTLPPIAPERSDGGSLTANTANHFVVRGQTTIRWVIANGPACGPPVMGGPVACAKRITVRAIPNTVMARATTIQGLVWR